jgi:hypothetical protein
MMMILGFAGVGFMAYRRKAKPALMAARSKIIWFELGSRLRVAFSFVQLAYLTYRNLCGFG